MKSRIKEQGSALHIAIIVILVVVVLGALGFIFWQNFINKPVTDSSTNNSQNTEQPISDQGTSEITEWGVKGTYAKNSEFPVEYVIDTSKSYDYAYFTTKSLPVDCANYGGIIKHFSAADVVAFSGGSPTGATAAEYYSENGGNTDKFKKIGDKYYLYESSQSLCKDPELAAMVYIRNVTGDFMESLSAK